VFHSTPKIHHSAPRVAFGGFFVEVRLSFKYTVGNGFNKQKELIMFAQNTNSNRYLFAYQKDGLVDIFIGLGVLFAGLFLITEMTWMVAIFVPTFLPVFQAARKRYLEPRLDEVRSDPEAAHQNQKNVRIVTVMMGLLLSAGIALLFGILSDSFSWWLKEYFLLSFGIIFAGAWALGAILMKQPRYWLHAFATFIPLTVAQFANIPFWMALSITGGLILLVGLIVFIRFLREGA